MSLLETENLTKNFGGLRALDNVSIKVKKGELHSIIGPNGAGKTTLFNVISGVFPPTSGKVKFNGKDITGLKPYQISHLGIGRSFQVISIFPALTVLENVRLATQSRGGYSFNLIKKVSDLKEPTEKAYELLEKVGLREKASWKASQLSHGEQRLLDIAITLATNPILLMLDEPTSGLSPEETTKTIETIRELAEDRTILLIEHKINVVLDVSDVITVLHRGCVLAEGTPEEIQRDVEVQKAYLGVR